MAKDERAGKGLDAMEKYMAPIPPHLAELVVYLNRPIEELPEWEQNLVARTKASVQFRIKEHFDAAAMTRQKFVSMSSEIWQDPENGMFKLTENPRKVLGYLPANELKRLDDLVRVPVTTAIEERRAGLDDMMDKMRASDPDRAEIADVMTRDTFFLKDLEDHQAAVEYWEPLHNKKVPVIAELEQREEFLEEIEEFEVKATGDKERYKKANSLALADENKFRQYAAKKLKELDSKAIKLCRQYEEETSREFQIDGVKYLEMIKEQKFGRSSNPSLSLAKLRPQAISKADKQRYAGGPSTNLTASDDVMGRRVSLHEQGEEPKIIRHRQPSGEK